ncbi:hypothetical protein LSH36_399g03006 [Paralvinella palmiformis]|uniref:Angiotensin-converting enzyme n=1 Tax=Paralvinella palmiformis TaxID=53620 RepID=A0AAD9JD58_9ANNE|nr:hypothetical protein LSH36_399g03006 [Paralvinella palmiformis]
MWAQQWDNILDIVTPYPSYPSLKVTKSLHDQNYTALRMFQVAEDFFKSLGFSSLPQTFWDHSMIEKPKDGRPVTCHASAWDFFNGKDFRLILGLTYRRWLSDLIANPLLLICALYDPAAGHTWIVRQNPRNPGYHVGLIPELKLDHDVIDSSHYGNA